MAEKIEKKNGPEYNPGSFTTLVGVSGSGMKLK